MADMDRRAATQGRPYNFGIHRLNDREMVVMPNHVHGVIRIIDAVDAVGADLRVRPGPMCPP